MGGAKMSSHFHRELAARADNPPDISESDEGDPAVQETAIRQRDVCEQQQKPPEQLR